LVFFGLCQVVAANVEDEVSLVSSNIFLADGLYCLTEDKVVYTVVERIPVTHSSAVEHCVPDSHGKSILLLLGRVEEERIEKSDSGAEHLNLKLSVVLEMIKKLADGHFTSILFSPVDVKSIPECPVVVSQVCVLSQSLSNYYKTLLKTFGGTIGSENEKAGMARFMKVFLYFSMSSMPLTIL
jgi:hypothetical protein